MNKFYMYESGAQQGPFSFAELKEQNISKDTPIWFEGLSDWTNAGDIDELKELFRNVPPPFPSPVAIPTPPSPPPVQRANNSYNPSPERQAKRDKAVGMRILLGFLIAFIAGGAGYYYLVRQNDSSYDTSSSYQEKILSVEEIERATPTDFLSVTGEYNDNFWGDKIKIKGSIINRATVVSYKDAVIKVTYLSKTGTELSSEAHTIYETVPANSSIEFKLKVDKGSDVASVRCELISAVAN